MKNVNYIPFLLILLLFSRNQKTKTKEIEVFYYPEIEKFEQNYNLKNILIDSIRNYKELLIKIDQIACNDSIPSINYSGNGKSFKLLPWYSCSEKYLVSCPTFRSRIFIQNDSIYSH
jgi:hypothetical protein